MDKKKIVIGIDQSYTRTGISVIHTCDERLFQIMSINFDKKMSNTQKREMLKENLEQLMIYLDNYTNNPHDILVITEQIRLFSNGHISQDYIKSTSALVATIIDFFYGYDLDVYSVDTRTWKRAIVGTDKPMKNKYGIDPKKYPTILYMRQNGLLKYIVEEYKGRGKKGVIPVNMNGKKVLCKINDDMADSYCIAKYGLLPEEQRKLKLEEF